MVCGLAEPMVMRTGWDDGRDRPMGTRRQARRGGVRWWGRGGAKWVLLGVVVGAVAAGTALVRQAGRAEAAAMLVTGRAESAEGVRRRSEAAYAGLTFVPIVRMSGPEEVRELLSRAPLEGGHRLSEGSRQKLLRHASEFVWTRLACEDIDEYLTWRRRNGYELRPREELDKKWMVGWDYEREFGVPWPEEERSEVSLSRFVQRGCESATRPVEMCDSSAGLGVCVHRTTKARQEMEYLKGELGTEAWYGAHNATFRNWWRGKRGMREVMLERGEVVVAQVGMVVRRADGVRCPLVVTLIEDPAEGAWVLEKLTVYNVPAEKVEAIEY